ncbi:MAG: hypothetical protein MZW92_68205 [Comamonadaceae bacterium]|nr:hypothetical protein [Comamonadaceae bacterium]
MIWRGAPANGSRALAYDDKASELRHQVFRGQAKGAAFLDDHALLGRGCLALSEATGDKIWLVRAMRLTDDILRRFALPDGRLRTSTADHDLLIVLRETGESVYPAGLSATVDLLQRLAEIEPRYRELAQPILRHATMQVAAQPQSWPFLAAVLYGSKSHPGVTRLDTAAHVRAGAVATRQGDYDEVIVTLVIDSGYHINANPASHDYLIPTTLRFDGVQPIHLRYPHATRFKASFSPTSLDVYEGAVRVIAHLPKGTLRAQQTIRAVVRARVCDDASCLPPADMPITVIAVN